MKYFGVLLIAMSFFSCFNRMPTAKIKNNEGLCDIDLVITDITKLDDGAIRIVAHNLLKNKEVYISLLIRNVWDEKPVENAPISFYWGTGKIERSNAAYQTFVNELAELYSLQKPVAIGTDDIGIGLVGLANDPRKMDKEDVSMKAFFNTDTGNEDLYAELFINVNLAKRVLQLHEKDSEYRASLIKALSGER